MALPTSQQHALDVIDDALQLAEPRLATMFGVFTDLTRLEAMPAAETLAPGRWWTRHRWPGPRYRPGWTGPRGRPGQPPSRLRPEPRPSGAGRAGRQLRPIVVLPLLFMAALSVFLVSLVGSAPAGQPGCNAAVAAVRAPWLRSTDRHAADSAGTSNSAGTSCPRGGSQTAARNRQPGTAASSRRFRPGNV